jgi:hypothetical protein
MKRPETGQLSGGWSPAPPTMNEAAGLRRRWEYSTAEYFGDSDSLTDLTIGTAVQVLPPDRKVSCGYYSELVSPKYFSRPLNT